MEVSASALLEWIDALKVSRGQRVQSVEDLRDGELLLHVMQDVAPDIFANPRSGPDVLNQLLEGLEEHFRHRPGQGERCARELLEQEVKGQDLVDISLLVQLVIWATLDNDLCDARRQRYLDMCENLSDFSKQAIMDIARDFGGAQSPHSVSSPTPVGQPNQGADSAVTHMGGSMVRTPSEDELPDFMEVGLDDETRYRRLKKRYFMVMEEQEKLEDERNHLRHQLEAEIKKRQDAEEGERMARMELRESDEARHRMKEENRALFEVRLEQEVLNYREQLKRRDKEINTVREERDMARAQAGKADKLSEQLTACKKRIEECQVWKREKEELQRQLDELLSSKNLGATEHLRDMLSRAREEATELGEERDEAQRQLEQVREEMHRLQDEHLAAREEVSRLQRRLSKESEEGSSGKACGTPTPDADDPAARAVAAMAGEGGRPLKEAGVEDLRQLLHTQKEDLLEKLLVEKERATRAETTLQLKLAEATALVDQRARDAEKLAALEEQLRCQDRGRGGQDDGRLRELQAVLAQRERELQVHRWRGQTESDSLVAQETLMVSCFHEIGLKYHKLLTQHDALRRRLGEYERAVTVDLVHSPIKNETSL